MVMWDSRRMDRKFDNTGELVPKWLNEFQNVIEQTREPRTMRAVVVAHFSAISSHRLLKKEKIDPKAFIKLGEAEKKKQFESSQILSKKCATDAQFIVSNCIKAGFIGKDEEDPNSIYLTLRGTKFATRFGLLKEWILEDIGELKIMMGVILVWIFREIIPHFINLAQTGKW